VGQNAGREQERPGPEKSGNNNNSDGVSGATVKISKPESVLPKHDSERDGNTHKDEALDGNRVTQSDTGQSQWLVVIEGFTAVILAIQSFVMWRAIVATRDSIRLQEKAFIQFVNLVEWKSIPVSGPERDEFGEMHPAKAVTIEACLINPTNFPLTLKGGRIEFTTRGRPSHLSD
jgi:hypothetical protein